MSLASIHSHHNTSVTMNALHDQLIFQSLLSFPMVRAILKTSLTTVSQLSLRGRCLRRFARSGRPLPVHPGDKFADEIWSIPLHLQRMQTSATRTGAL